MIWEDTVEKKHTVMTHTILIIVVKATAALSRLKDSVWYNRIYVFDS